MIHQIEVRKAITADYDAIAGLLEQLGYPTTSAQVPARLDRLTGDGRATVFVAQREGKVVGLATVHVLSVLNRNRDVAWLTALVVDASIRKSGIGRALVEAVESFARQAGCERLSVTTHEQLTDAHAFYLGVGLQQTGRRFGKMLTA
jgi:GNAT superfamily N-acetyltransferase